MEIFLEFKQKQIHPKTIIRLVLKVCAWCYGLLIDGSQDITVVALMLTWQRDHHALLVLVVEASSPLKKWKRDAQSWYMTTCVHAHVYCRSLQV